LSDLDIRLRYLLCSVFEDMIRRLFPGAENRLFGSSVSGLGRHDCDLDMVMDLDKSPPNNRVGISVWFMEIVILVFLDYYYLNRFYLHYFS